MLGGRPRLFQHSTQSRLNSLNRVAFVDLCKPPTYKNSLPHQPNTRCFCWSQISLPTLKTSIFSENWWLEDDAFPFKLVTLLPLESHQVLRWLPRLNEEFTFGAQEDRDGRDPPDSSNISHLGKRKSIDSKVPLKGGYVSLKEGICFWIHICHWFHIQGRMIHPSWPCFPAPWC